MRIIRFVVVWACVAQLILPQWAMAFPGWWTDDNAQTRIISAAATPNNYGPVNLGQLKYVATQAKKYLDLQLATNGGAGSAINAMVAAFEPIAGQNYTPEQLAAIHAANLSPVNLGQLKAVALPFYQRLIEVGYDTRGSLIANGYPGDWAYEYPWNPNDTWNQSGSADKSVNYGIANIGQLKMAFSFDLSTTDSNSSFLSPSLLQAIESAMATRNPPPARLGWGGNSAPGITGGTSSPGGGGSGAQTDPDHDPQSTDANVPPTLAVGAKTTTDPDSGEETSDPTVADLTWTYRGAAAQSVDIQRRTGAAAWETISSANGGTTEYSDDGRLANVSYVYRLSVTFASGEKLFSNPVTYQVPFYTGFQSQYAGVDRWNPGIPEFVPSWPPLYYLTETTSGTRNHQFSDDNGGSEDNGSYTEVMKLDPTQSTSYYGPGAVYTYDGSSTDTATGWAKASDSHGNPSTTSWGESSTATQNQDGTWTGSYSWWNFDADGNKTSGQENITEPMYSGGPGGDITTTATTISGIQKVPVVGGENDDSGSIVLSQEYKPSDFFSDTFAKLSQAQFTDWAPDGFTPERGYAEEMDNIAITKGNYKWELNPSAPFTDTWYILFIPYTPQSDQWGVPFDDTTPGPPQIVGSNVVNGGGTESSVFTLDPSSVPDQFSPGSPCGTYTFISGLQITATGSLLDTTAPNGTLTANDNLDPQERTGGAAIVHAPDANGNGAVSGTVSFWGPGMDDENYTIQISSSDFTVTDAEGNIITNGQSFDDSDNPGSLVVTPNASASEGERVTITVTLNSSSGFLGTQTVVFTNETKLGKDYSIPLDEASGSRYRKIGLNGRPLADEKPQHTAESDEEKEETYIDALTLGLHHSTTDVYVSVAGSDLNLSARRDTASEVWNMNSGLRPHERLDRPFGAAWASNLCPYVETISADGGATYTYVVDQNGARHRFVYAYNSSTFAGGYVPVPSDSRENGDYLTTFDGRVFTDRYGTKITFSQPPITQAVNTNRNEQSGTEVHVFTAATQVVDRVGNTLNYTYPNNASADGSTPNTINTLIPSTISFAGASNQTLSIAQDGSGHVTAIWDPNGNKFTYQYATKVYQANNQQYQETVLTSVTGPDGKTSTNYDYGISIESDQTPADLTNGQPTDKLHLDLTKITDPSANTYTFTYAFDQTRMNYDIWGGNYFPETGAPSYVTNVQLPGNLGSASFSNAGSKVALSTELTAQGGLQLTPDSNRTNTVVDAGNNTIIYRFGVGSDNGVNNSQVFSMGGFYPNTPPVAVPKVVFYLKMQIDYGIGSETFAFDPTAGMALSKVTDFSGNVTTYVYGDSYSPPMGSFYSTIFPFQNFNSKYADPTQQTNALQVSKYFHYSSNFRIMDSMTDENRQYRSWDVDSYGRRLNEKIFVGGMGSSELQETDYGYDRNFPGMVADKVLLSFNSPQWAGNLETHYYLDGNGRVQYEVVDPRGLALTTEYTYDNNGNKRSFQNPRGPGFTTYFGYDGWNRLTGVVYPDGSAKSITYYANGQKETETDENLHLTKFFYDALNRLTNQTRYVATGNIVTQYGYTDAVRPKTSVTDPNLNQTTYQYDNLQRLSTMTDALGHSTHYYYDGGNSGAYAFDSSGFKPTKVVDPRNYQTLITYDGIYRTTQKSVQYQDSAFSTTNTVYDNLQNPLQVTDPVGNTTTTVFDALNRPTEIGYADGTTNLIAYTSTGLKWQVTDELLKSTLTQYDGAGRPVLLIEPPVPVNGNPNQMVCPETKTNYDRAGNVIAKINPLNYEWDYSYDARNRKIEEDQPAVFDAMSGQTTRPVIYTGYDYVGNVLWVLDARGYTTETVYDEANRPLTVTAPPVLISGGTGEVRPSTTKTYDPNGNVLTVEDPNGYTTTNHYDVLNRLHKTTDADNITVCYEYDAVGNPISVKDGLKQETTFGYDGLNRNTTTTDAATHTTTLAYDGLNKVSRTDALTQITNYGYDKRNRLHTVTYPSGASNDNRTYSYDPTGHLLSVTEPGYNGAANASYTYDNLHRVSSETNNGVTHTYGYDQAGNRTMVKYAGDGRELDSKFDALNRLEKLTDASLSTVNSQQITGYSYDLAGNLAIKSLPNGDSISYWCDGLNRVYEEEGNSVQGQLYHYLSLTDKVGNLVSSVEYTKGVPARTVTLGYDEINRLTSEQVTGPTGASVSNTAYDYDAANNRSHKTVNGSVTTYSYNDVNQITGWSDGTGNSASFAYDANGNRQTRTVGSASDTYAYDVENRLVNLVKQTPATTLNSQQTVPGTYSYVYDYRTRRVDRTENGTTTEIVFSGGNSVQEYFASGALGAEYVRGSDRGGGVGGILYSVRGGLASFAHYNRRGDVTAHTDTAGSVTWQASYEAGGTRTAEYGATQDRQKANTKEEDPTGLKNEGMRYYDLETDTFITKDPAGFVDGPNLYAYVRQNPWTKFDPEGLEETAAGAKVDRDGHHVSPVETWDKNGLSKEVQEHLNEVRIKNDDVDHGWSKAHKSYNERADEITKDYVKNARKLGKDPSSMSAKEAKDFADGLVKELNKDEYISKFNEMVEAGHGTAKELNAMRKVALAEGVLTDSGMLAKFGRVAAKAEGLAEHLPLIGWGLAALGFAADAKSEGVNQAAVNSIKSATFYDVTAEPAGKGTMKAMDGLIHIGGPTTDRNQLEKLLRQDQ
jgi:RHS repeat-associated protein